MSRPACIFCREEHSNESVEHIVPRSLGNLHYILGKGLVCAGCNNRFGLFEQSVLSSTLFLAERKSRRLLRSGHEEHKGHQLDTAKLKRFLLKMAYESLYISRPKVFAQFDKEPVRQCLLHGTGDDRFHPIAAEVNLVFKSIPSWIERFRLKNNGLKLEFAIHDDQLYFRFTFGRIVAGLRIA